MKKIVYLLATFLMMANAFASDVNSGLPIGQVGTGTPIIIPGVTTGNGQEGTGADDVKVTKPGETEDLNNLKERIKSLAHISPELSAELEFNIRALMLNRDFVMELNNQDSSFLKETMLIETGLKMSGIEFHELTPAERDLLQ